MPECGPIFWGVVVLACPISFLLLVAVILDLTGPALLLKNDLVTNYPRSEKSINRSYPLFDGTAFDNPWSTWPPIDVWKSIKWMLSSEFRNNFPAPAPPLDLLESELPVKKPNFDVKSPNSLQLTWLGHATTLVRMDGISIITDPIFSEFCSPVEIEFTRRIRPVPCSVKDLPDDLRFVLISHNHYDHLDLSSIIAIHRRFGTRVTFCVPKGQGSWFLSNVPDIEVEQVVEFGWWEMANFDNLQIVSVPAQHLSTRHPFNKNRILWCGWVVIGPSGRKFYFAGDTGYCPAFKEIGAEFGPIDLSAIPIGAYNPQWLLKPQHTNPEDAVQVHLDVQSKHSVAIHWGTFRLGGEETFEPKLKLDSLARDLKMPFVTLCPGETLNI